MEVQMQENCFKIITCALTALDNVTDETCTIPSNNSRAKEQDYSVGRSESTEDQPLLPANTSQSSDL